jgi:hypothetical protein
MLQLKSVFWFLPRTFKNNLLFISGNFLIFSVQYLILESQQKDILNLNWPWFPLFTVFSLIAIIYNLIFYLKHSMRLGLLMLYGLGKAGVFLIVFLENMIILLFSILINLLVSVAFSLIPVLFMTGLIAVISFLSVTRYFFTSIYQTVKGS